MIVYVPKGEDPRVKVGVKPDEQAENDEQYLYTYNPGRVVPVYFCLVKKVWMAMVVKVSAETLPGKGFPFLTGGYEILLEVQGNRVKRLQRWVSYMGRDLGVAFEDLERRYWIYLQADIVRRGWLVERAQYYEGFPVH